MDSVLQALFQQMRLTILLTAKDGIEESPFTPAYLYAWERGVYPLMSSGREWHEPHEAQFHVRKTELEELLKFLDGRWLEKNPISFYDLEDQYQARLGRGDWDRAKLTTACRYIFLEGGFDRSFWNQLNGQCPSEALHIADESPDAVYFQ